MQVFKKTLSTLCLIIMVFGAALAQKADRAQEIRRMIWKKQGEQYQNTTIPEKWKNESAVILFQDYSHVYDGKGKRIEAENAYHLRIALLDKAAVKEYSEFSFNEKFNGRTSRRGLYRGVTYTGFRVIKEDGTEEIINLGEAVRIESEDGDNTKKIAIPNLQVGDIIDYYYYEEERLTLADYVHVFTPVVSTISADYPIVYLKKQFTVEKNFHISYKAVNGAPELQEEVNAKQRIFSLEARDLEKVEETEWMYANRSLPTIKFQVFYTKHGRAAQLPNFIGEEGSIKGSVTEDDIAKFIKKVLGQTFVFDQRSFEAYLKTQSLSAGSMSRVELAKEIYFYLYNERIGKNLESYYLGNIDYPGINDYLWIGLMEAAFIKNNIASYLLVVPDRVYSDHEDLLFLEELNYLIKVDNGEEDVYFSNFYLHPVVNQIPPDAQNVKAFESKLTSLSGRVYIGYANPSVEIVDIPAEPTTKNNSNVLSDVKLKEDMSGLIFDNSYMYTGLNRDYYQYRLLNLSEYLYDEYKIYGISSLAERVKKKNKATINDNIRGLKTRQEKNRLETLEGIVASDYALEEADITSFEVTSIGRRDNPLFSYDVKFSIEGLVKQAGPNYLLDAGLLVSTQREIAEKDRKDRKVDIYSSNPRSYDTAITVHIPEGYTVEGVDKLNMNVQNETGVLHWPLMR